MLTQIIASSDDLGRMFQLNFRESPISQVMDLYSMVSKTPITITPGTYSTITLVSDGRVSESQVVDLIESAIDEYDLTITKSKDGIIISPANGSRYATSDGVEYITTNTLFRYEPVDKAQRVPVFTNKNTASMTKDETKHHLLEYRKQLKRAGLPPPPLSDLEKELGITDAEK